MYFALKTPKQSHFHHIIDMRSIFIFYTNKTTYSCSQKVHCVNTVNQSILTAVDLFVTLAKVKQRNVMTSLL